MKKQNTLLNENGIYTLWQRAHYIRVQCKSDTILTSSCLSCFLFLFSPIRHCMDLPFSACPYMSFVRLAQALANKAYQGINHKQLWRG